jgi:dihydroneopterin aldolase
MSDTIFVSGLLIHAHHGVMAHEGEVGQRFVIDLELSIDVAKASRSDKLADTVDYGAIVDTTTEVFTRRNYRLIEAAGGAVADAILAKFARVNTVRITVRKPHAPIAAIFTDAGCTITRQRHG